MNQSEPLRRCSRNERNLSLPTVRNHLQGIVDPTRFASNFKLDLGSTTSVLGDGSVFTPTDATAALVATLKQDAGKSTGIQVTEAVATCPANFRGDAKQALLEAFERCGIRDRPGRG